MPRKLINEKSTLVKVIALCHYLWIKIYVANVCLGHNVLNHLPLRKWLIIVQNVIFKYNFISKMVVFNTDSSPVAPGD